MSDIFAAQITAVANVVLAVFAIATAVLALLAWRKQSKEVSDQAEMLGLQREQLEAQREDSAKQAGVLELQAAELRESLDERKREAEDRRRNQAQGVVAWFGLGVDPTLRGAANRMEVWGATIRNASDLPVFDVQISFYWIDEPTPGLGWTPVPQGSATRILRVLAPAA